ncbi:MAG: hypothetical protein HY391_02515 [Deltaproteobacteria bacterium]|nr:hypothetical protein [Deltaproteobacteria bacterium]
MMRQMILGSLIFLALFLSSCATKVLGLKQSSNFTYSAIMDGKIVVGGVTSALGPLEEGKSVSLANLLRTSILEERKSFSVGSVGGVMNRLGSPLYLQISNEFRMNAELSDESQKRLSKVFSDYRFVVFARIEEDEVTQNRREESTTNDKGETLEKVIATSTRTITALLTVYDLRLNEIAWSGSISKNGMNQNEYKKAMGLIMVIEVIKGGPETTDDRMYPYPKPPADTELLERIFEGFAENLPKKED